MITTTDISSRNYLFSNFQQPKTYFKSKSLVKVANSQEDIMVTQLQAFERNYSLRFCPEMLMDTILKML